MSKPTLHTPSPKSRMDDLYASLTRRFSRSRKPEPVVYEFTSDRALLHQYYRIREMMYRKIHNTDKFSGTEDLHDKIAHILVARRGKLVIGGCRLIIRDGDEEFPLPMEEDEFKIRDIFYNLPLNKIRHGEISRFAIDDDDEDKLEIMLNLSQLIIEKCKSAGLAYAFLKAPGLAMARNWRKIGQAHCGLSKMRICTEIKVPGDPDYPDINWAIVEIPLLAPEVAPAPALNASEELYAMPTEPLMH